MFHNFISFIVYLFPPLIVANTMTKIQVENVFLYGLLLIGFVEPIYCMKVTIFNVGQGSCALAEHPDENEPLILIDAGTTKHPIQAKKNQKMREIANIIINSGRKLIIVATHAHRDHVNWIPRIIKNIKPENVQSILLGGPKEDYQKVDPKNPNKKTFLEKIMPLEPLFSTDPLTFQEHLPSFCKLVAYNNEAEGDANNRSIVVKLSYKKDSILIPGDATGKVIDNIVEEAARIFVASHHGSVLERCNEYDFIVDVYPEVIIISATETGYKHPNYELFLNALTEGGRVQKRHLFHTVTFYLGNTANRLSVIKKLKKLEVTPVLFKENGYCTAITNRAIFGTQDSDDIEIVIGAKHEQALSTTVRESSSHRTEILRLLTAIQLDRTSDITELEFPESNLKDNDLIKLTALPHSLKKLNLCSNYFTADGLKKILFLMTKHTESLRTLLYGMDLLVDDFQALILKNPALVQLLLKEFSVAVLLKDRMSKKHRLLTAHEKNEESMGWINELLRERFEDQVTKELRKLQLMGGATDAEVIILPELTPMEMLATEIQDVQILARDEKIAYVNENQLRRYELATIVLFANRFEKFFEKKIEVLGDDRQKALEELARRLRISDQVEAKKATARGKSRTRGCIREHILLPEERENFVKTKMDETPGNVLNKVVLGQIKWLVAEEGAEAEKLKVLSS